MFQKVPTPTGCRLILRNRFRVVYVLILHMFVFVYSFLLAPLATTFLHVILELVLFTACSIVFAYVFLHDCAAVLA
jgi:hypothetical protein